MIKFLKKMHLWFKKIETDNGKGIVYEEIDTRLDITGLDEIEKEKLKAKLLNKLNKLEVEKLVGNELLTLNEELERAKLVNMLNKIKVEDKMNENFRMMEEEEELASHINRMNKIDIDKSVKTSCALQKGKGKYDKSVQSGMMNVKKEDLHSIGKIKDIVQMVGKLDHNSVCKEVRETMVEEMEQAQEINRLRKSENKERLGIDLNSFEDEQLTAKLINRQNKLDIEDKLVRNFIMEEKDQEMDYLVMKLAKENSSKEFEVGKKYY